MAVKWNGDRIVSGMERAQMSAINRIMARAERHAVANHTWQNQTGTLEGSINVVRFAARDGSGISGEWGSQDVRYALVHELGLGNVPPRPYLRPAADATYSDLGDEIRREFQ